MKRALKWLRDNADTIGIGCMWVSAVLSLVLLRDTQRACMWAMFAIVCSVQNRHRAELDRLRIEANVTKELIGAIVTDLDRLRIEANVTKELIGAIVTDLDRLRIEANVTKELIGAIVTDLDRALKCVQIWTDNVKALHLKIDRVEGAMLKGKGN